MDLDTRYCVFVWMEVFHTIMRLYRDNEMLEHKNYMIEIHSTDFATKSNRCLTICEPRCWEKVIGGATILKATFCKCLAIQSCIIISVRGGSHFGRIVIISSCDSRRNKLIITNTYDCTKVRNFRIAAVARHATVRSAVFDIILKRLAVLVMEGTGTCFSKTPIRVERQIAGSPQKWKVKTKRTVETPSSFLCNAPKTILLY